MSMDEAYEKAKSIKNKREKYTFIYRYVCDYLDNDFINKNLCEFKNNTCGKERQKGRCKENACCNTRVTKGTCPNLVDGKCVIKCMACKLFACSYLKKKGIKYRIKDFKILKDNFNWRQKYYLWNNIMTPEDEMIKILLKYRGIKMFRLF